MEAAAQAQRTMTANDRQIGGTHYKKCAIEPWDYNAVNGLPFLEGSVVKYITRWRDKGGIDDLRKTQHYLEKIIENESRRLEVELIKELSTDPTRKPPSAYAPPENVVPAEFRSAILNEGWDARIEPERIIPHRGNVEPPRVRKWWDGVLKKLAGIQ